MISHLRPAVVLIAFFTLLTGVAYPLAMTGIAQGLFPAAANGSLVVLDGVTRGSSLIGQTFQTDAYFHGRPSAAAYDAALSTGSNEGPSSAVLLQQVEQRAAAYPGDKLPADLLTASASGLDPDVSPAGALVQVQRVAAARGLPESQLTDLVVAHTRGPDLGVFGEPRVNVLALNLALDALKP